MLPLRPSLQFLRTSHIVNGNLSKEHFDTCVTHSFLPNLVNSRLNQGHAITDKEARGGDRNRNRKPYRRRP